MDEFWLKQVDQPLFPEAHWGRPEQKAQAKRLLIIGGSEQGFEQTGRLFQAAINAGIGHAKVALPSNLKNIVGSQLPDTVFVDLSPSTNDTKVALNALLAFAQWADGVVGVQLGRNSRTALLIASFTQKFEHNLIVTDDLVESLKHDPELIIRRPKTLFVHSFKGLLELVKLVKSEVSFRHDMGLRPFVLALKQFNEHLNTNLVVIYDQTIVVSVDGKVVTTQRAKHPDPVMLSAYCGTWWLQQPQQPLVALANAVLEF